ncbi:MAG: ATP-binding protein, partial [Nodosilinea sp.]
MALLNQIRQGEGKTLELKMQLPQRDQIAKTVVAFSNTSGGKLVIGVDDDRQVVGLGEGDVLDLQDWVASIVFDRCYPAI